jgi:hypothetical protein
MTGMTLVGVNATMGAVCATPGFLFSRYVRFRAGARMTSIQVLAEQRCS